VVFEDGVEPLADGSDGLGHLTAGCIVEPLSS